MRRLIGVQYLRAVAAIGVVIFHAANHTGFSFTIGQAGVDLFFVLSGFLMVAITGPDTRPLSFMADRLRRIAPVYWIVTSVMLAGGLLGLFPRLRLDEWHVVSSYLFIPSFSPNGGEIWPLVVPGWTLNYEMFFYAIFALLLPVAREHVRVALLVIFFALLAAAGPILQPTSAITMAYTNPIMMEFAAGALVGLAWKEAKLASLPANLLIILAIALYIPAAAVENLASRPLVYGVPALLLVLGCLAWEQHRAVAVRPVPLLLGDASYSIYIWHGLAISVVGKAFGMAGFPAALEFVACVISGIAIGLAGYVLIERPILRMLKERRFAGPVPIPSGP